MTAQASSIQESVKKDHIAFQEILTDEELATHEEEKRAQRAQTEAARHSNTDEQP